MPRAAVVLVLALLLPALAAAFDSRFSLSPGQMCGSRWQGKYAPFSAYESNLKRLAATVAAEVNSSPCNCSDGRVAGDRPDQVSMSAFCHWRPDDAASSDCGACVALAFQEARWRCLFHRQNVAVADGGACSVSFHDVYRMEQSVGMGKPLPEIFETNTSLFRWIRKVVDLLDPRVLVILLLQATGVACLVFLFLQEWRDRNRGRASDDNSPVTDDPLGLDA